MVYLIADRPFARGPFGLVTIHRPENTDDSAKLAALLDGLARVSEQMPLGYQLIGNDWSEAGLLNLCGRYTRLAQPL